uniref:Uncharacterized protein n=1 Tax=Glossina austeni TaxID=7395 RepID=A0A1A9VIB5_GLOAU
MFIVISIPYYIALCSMLSMKRYFILQSSTSSTSYNQLPINNHFRPLQCIAMFWEKGHFSPFPTDHDVGLILLINPRSDKSNYSYSPVLNLNFKMPEIGYRRVSHLRSLLLLLYGNVNINNYNKREIIPSST